MCVMLLLSGNLSQRMHIRHLVKRIAMATLEYFNWLTLICILKEMA